MKARRFCLTIFTTVVCHFTAGPFMAAQASAANPAIQLADDQCAALITNKPSATLPITATPVALNLVHSVGYPGKQITVTTLGKYLAKGHPAPNLRINKAISKNDAVIEIRHPRFNDPIARSTVFYDESTHTLEFTYSFVMSTFREHGLSDVLHEIALQFYPYTKQIRLNELAETNLEFAKASGLKSTPAYKSFSKFGFSVIVPKSQNKNFGFTLLGRIGATLI